MENELSSHSKGFLSVEDYFRIEETALRKSEYLNGEMNGNAGVSREHTLIVTNLVFNLELQLLDRPYEVYSSELRLKVSATGLYTYPDVIVSDAEPAFEDRGGHTFLNPILLVEVLSKATESYDRGRKFSHYQRVSSLQEYVLVSNMNSAWSNTSVSPMGNGSIRRLPIRTGRLFSNPSRAGFRWKACITA